MAYTRPPGCHSSHESLCLFVRPAFMKCFYLYHYYDVFCLRAACVPARETRWTRVHRILRCARTLVHAPDRPYLYYLYFSFSFSSLFLLYYVCFLVVYLVVVLSLCHGDLCEPGSLLKVPSAPLGLQPERGRRASVQPPAARRRKVSVLLCLPPFVFRLSRFAFCLALA